jgi:signal transduction histidine kinase
MARAGELDNRQFCELLRSCIDDLRLAIDTSDGSEDSLLVALGNLRFRMQPRLKAAGITLHWDTLALSHHRTLRPQVQLSALRIVQECLTNALKHARATRINVVVGSTDAELVIRIEDDGQGFDVGKARTHATGKGLNGLYKRARMLDAELTIDSSQRGSVVLLKMPMGA